MPRDRSVKEVACSMVIGLAITACGAEKASAQPIDAASLDEVKSAQDEVMRLFREGLPAFQDGNFSTAEPLWARGLEIAERELPRDHPYILMALTYVAELYRAQGRVAEAVPLASRALESNERYFGPEHPRTLNSLNSLAVLYGLQDRDAEAELLLRRALETAERNYGRDHPYTLTFVGNMAVAHLGQGRDAEAEPLLRHVLQVREQQVGRDDPSLIGDLNNLGLLLMRQGHYVEAEPLFRRVLELAEQALGRDHPDAVGPLHNLGFVIESQGRHTEAEPLYRRALETAERALGRDHPDTLRHAENLVMFDLEQGRTTPDTLQAARLMVEGLSARQSAGNGNQAILAQRDREQRRANGNFALFGDAAWASAQEDDQRVALLFEAFTALQLSVLGPADRSIARRAAQRYATGQSVALGPLIAEREEMERRWTALDGQVAASYGTAGRPAAILEGLEQVQARIGQIDAQLRAEAQDYFALIRPEPLNLPLAQALLAPDEAILLVVPSKYGTHVITVTRDDAQWWRSGWNARRVRTAAQQLRWDSGARVDGTDEELAALQARPQSGRPSFDRTTAHSLYQELIQPGASLLAGKRRVYVAAGGSLAALPFQVLVSAPPSGADNDPAALRETRWFGDDFALVHIPSLQSLALLRQASVEPGDGFVGIGDPVLAETRRSRNRDTSHDPSIARQLFTGGTTRDGGIIANVSTLRRLSRLPGTAVELESVRKTLDAPLSSLLLAERATEPNVRSADLSRARILLFSTHGLTAPESLGIGVGEAGLVLTPPVEASDGDDGFLAASEVTTLLLNADWVILSACNTATGDGTTGAGLGGLARAFFYAGARNLLASHWPVSDAVAPILITRTLALERAGTPRAEAFREAMREIRMDSSHDTAEDSWAHPFYWAPFVLVGDGGR